MAHSDVFGLLTIHAQRDETRSKRRANQCGGANPLPDRPPRAGGLSASAYDAVLENAAVALANGDRLHHLVSAVIDQLTDHDCPPAERMRLRAIADQLEAALDHLRASGAG